MHVFNLLYCSTNSRNGLFAFSRWIEVIDVEPVFVLTSSMKDIEGLLKKRKIREITATSLYANFSYIYRYLLSQIVI